MPDLIIDGRPVTVPKGTPVIAAAEALGIVIPRFCWHPALGAAGACRMCAVMFLEGPVKGLEMSCMVPAADGMVVSTGHPEAVAFRSRVVELLMTNHPHDCPVCDEGGHCLLQDETISGGHALRRFPGRKRTYLDQDLGPFVQHEMNRCIHCYRCVRFYQEYCGYFDFGPMQNANRVYFGRFASGPLENPFSGNLADICPTGTLTDKPARFTSRRWDCQRAPSVCLHCSLGCNTVALSRYRAITRIEARENPAVNGHFICDRGRYSFGFATSAERPRQARVDGVPTDVDAAVTQAAARLGAVVATHGQSAVAVTAGARSSLETLAALAALARAGGWQGPAVFPDRATQAAVTTALALLDGGRARSLAEVAKADAVLCLGVSALCDAPMLALSLRQATRADAAVIVADPRPVTLPLPFTHLPLPPTSLAEALTLLAGPAPADAAAIQQWLPLFPHLWAAVEQASQTFAAAKRPVIVFAPPFAAQVAAILRDDARTGLFPVLSGPNAAGAALLAAPDAPSLDALAAAIETGDVRALILAEADAAAASPKLAAMLGRLETLVVLDNLPTPGFAAAKVFLPTQTLFEAGGTLCNNEGRLQYAAPVAPPGEPVSRDGHGDHPPRDYARKLPGTDPQPAAGLCAALAAAMGLSMSAPSFAAATGIAPGALGASGARVTQFPAFPPAVLPEPLDAAKGLVVVRDDALFGTDEPGRYAALARAQAPAVPVVRLHTADAATLGLHDGAAVAVTLGERACDAVLAVHDNMARGVLVAPRLPQWAGLPPVLDPTSLRRRQP